jgi:YD repeat-containing protein
MSVIFCQSVCRIGSGNLTNFEIFLGTSVAQECDCACGLLSARTDRDGTITEFTYNALKQLLTSTKDAMENETTYSYAY